MKSFSTKLVLELTQATKNQLKYWVRVQLVLPTKKGKFHYYSFRDIIKLRMIVSLKKQGLSLQKIRIGLQNLTCALPQSDDFLTRLVIFTNGIDMIVYEKGRHFSAITKQQYLSFDTEEIQVEIIKLNHNLSEDVEADNQHVAVMSY